MLSLRQRLYLALGALLLLQIVGGVISLLSVRAYRDNTRNLVEDTLPELVALGEIKSELHGLLYETVSVMVTGESHHAEHRVESIEHVRTNLDNLEKAANTKLSDETSEKLVFERLRATAEKTIETSDWLAGSAGAVGPVRQVDGLLRLDEDHDAFGEVLDEVSTLVASEGEQAVAATAGDPSIAPLVLALLSVALSALLFRQITKRVLRPILRLRDVTDAVAAGDLSRRSGLEGSDEIGALGHSFDAMVATIAEQQRALRERAEALEQANLAQRRLNETVRTLTVPAIPIGQGVLALPLLGALDSERLQSVTSTLLQRVTQEQTHTVILDVTGLAEVSGETAGQLLQISQGVQLLGARCILTGMSPGLALQAVDARMDLRQLRVQPTLGEGLALALAENGRGHN
ncbi:MAG TPA: HAMP domain-containing protein [Roseiflexaceae bacterium]|nr:HAMP domain-containing protein [Roseiflexaceae bacterium]